MFDQTFLSPQVKRSVIISNKHSIYKLPHELPSDLILRIPRYFRRWAGFHAHTRKKIDLKSQEIGKDQENLKTSYNYSLVLNLPPKMKIFSILVKNSRKTETELFQ